MTTGVTKGPPRVPIEQDEYPQALRRVLKLPERAEEAEGALRASQFLYLPSFDIEAAVSVIEHADRALVVVRVPSEHVSAWLTRVPSYGEHLLPKRPPKAFFEARWFETDRVQEYRAAIDRFLNAPAPEPVVILDGTWMHGEIGTDPVSRYEHALGATEHPAQAVTHEVFRLAWEAAKSDTIRRVIHAFGNGVSE